MSLGWRPLTPLRITNTWLRTSLSVEGDRRAFVTDIVRTQWAWQFTREWSIRLIGQYEGTATDSTLTRVTPRRSVNGDVLLTRLINPWTALYVGYNGNAQNVAIDELTDGRRTLRRTDRLAIDAWQVFVKWSHLLRW